MTTFSDATVKEVHDAGAAEITFSYRARIDIPC
jgi:hypothetical protein